MKVLIILNREPYDNTDVTWNSLRLAVELAAGSNEVRLFLMNDAVDLARRLQPAGGLRPVSVENAQGVDREWSDRESLRNLHDRVRHLQEPTPFRRSREIDHAGAGRLGSGQRQSDLVLKCAPSIVLDERPRTAYRGFSFTRECRRECFWIFFQRSGSQGTTLIRPDEAL